MAGGEARRVNRPHPRWPAELAPAANLFCFFSQGEANFFKLGWLAAAASATSWLRRWSLMCAAARSRNRCVVLPPSGAVRLSAAMRRTQVRVHRNGRFIDKEVDNMDVRGLIRTHLLAIMAIIAWGGSVNVATAAPPWQHLIPFRKATPKPAAQAGRVG